MTSLSLNAGLFIQPKKVPPSAWIGHIPFAAWLIRELRPSSIVELGTHYGTSYLAFCQVVQELSLETRCFAIDTWEGDEHAGLYGNEVFSELNDYHQRYYAGFSRLMRMRFEDAVGYFEDGSLDMLHIDGLHTYEAVKNDFETWLPKVSSRGVVLFHDTAVRDRGFGVWKFWAEIKKKYPSFEFTHTHGLGVLLVGGDVPAVIVDTLSSSNIEHLSHLNQLFDALGCNLKNVFEIERLNEAVSNCYREITRLTNELSSRDAVIEGLNQTARGTADTLAALTEVGRRHGEGVSELSAILRAQMAGVVQQLGSAESGFSELSVQVSAATSGMAELSRHVEATAEGVAKLSRYAASTAEDLSGLAEQSRAHGVAISELHQRLVEVREQSLVARLRRLLKRSP